ncbi:MAG: hypothetical protein ACP5GB_01955, partial [Candidatus Micrarchaeia archaeon]
MVEGVTKTSIDALVEYLKSHGETDAQTLAKALGVTETLIEEWSNILEKSNVVKIIYRAGKMYVAPLSVTKESVEEVQHRIEIEKESIINEAMAQINTLNQLNEKIEKLSEVIKKGDEILKKRMGPLKGELDELYKMSSIAEKRYNEVKKKKNEIDTIAERLEKEARGLKERASSIENFHLNITNVEKLIQDIHNKIGLMHELLEEEEANRKKAIKQLEESERRLANSIKEEIESINNLIFANAKELEESKRINETYKKDAIRLRMELEQKSKKILEEVSK